jgi:hypothetical protein
MGVMNTTHQKLLKNIAKKASRILRTVSNAMQMDANMTINFFTKDALAGARSNDLSQRGKFDGASSQSQKDTRTITMTIVTWFGTLGYCEYYDYTCPSPNRCKPGCYSP